MVAVTMATLWSIYLVVLFSVHPAHSHRSLQGLSCLNDFVNNVSCTWNSSQVDPAVDCWIFGQKKAWTGLIKQGCKLKQLGSSVQGCSVVFENRRFTCAELMPRIHVECNGTLVESLTDYKPCDHIKMHPPSVVNVSASANQTWISWSPRSSHSYFFASFEFQVQIKQNHQKWKEATTLSTEKQEIRIDTSGRKAGLYQARVRVKPPVSYRRTHWSDWSPTASWERASAPEDQVPLLDRTSWFMLGGISLSTLLIVILLVLLRGCSNRGLLKGKPVPNPSEYFHTLHSVHGGDIKEWLNPQTASGSFFTAQPRDHISPVQVFDTWDAVPSTSPSSSSTSALLHFHPGRCPSTDSDGGGGSGMHRSASTASSGFSNLGYFYSSCPGSDSLRIDASPVYFTYQDDFRNPHLHLHLPLASSPPYECLRRPGGERKSEPQSPDSGFGIGMEDEAGEGEGRDADGDRHGSPLLVLPLHLPSRLCPPSFPLPPSPSSSSPPPPSHPPGPPQVQPDNRGPEVPAAAPSGSYVAWPAGGAMCRSSSMPVEPCKTGYLTLKELQTTYSNKSI